jgi:hypothetical protein
MDIVIINFIELVMRALTRTKFAKQLGKGFKPKLSPK